jgi:predicted DNA-binding protein
MARPRKENPNTLTGSYSSNRILEESIKAYCGKTGKVKSVVIRKAIEAYIAKAG